MKKVPIEEIMKQTFPNGIFVDSEGLDIRYKFDKDDYLVFLNETDSHEAAAVITHCLNTHNMLLNALKSAVAYPVCGNWAEQANKAIQSASFVEVQE